MTASRARAAALFNLEAGEERPVLLLAGLDSYLKQLDAAQAA